MKKSVDADTLSRTIMGALQSRPPALWPFAVPKYLRECQVHEQTDGIYSCRLALRGYGYKQRGPRPKNPPVIEPGAVAVAFNRVLVPLGFYVTEIEETGTHLILIMEMIK